MKVLFMGRKPAAADALEWTACQGIDVVGVVTDSHLAGSPTAARARELGLPLLSLEEVVHRVESGSIEIDCTVSFLFWRIIKPPLLGLARLGSVNFHPAPLPAYRGTAGYNAAILDHLEEWAVTAHYMDAGIDTGGIIDAFRFSIDHEEETAQSLERKSQEFMLGLYKKTLRRIRADGILPSTPNEGGRYISRSEMEDMKRIQPGDDVDRKIRAFWFPPYRGAWVQIGDQRYTLINDRILKDLAPPGTTTLHTLPDRRPG
jgi:methionyl-tRNA formyltransferase